MSEPESKLDTTLEASTLALIDYLVVEGDINIHIQGPHSPALSSDLARRTSAQLLARCHSVAKSAKESLAPGVVIRDPTVPYKIMVDGYRVDGRDATTDHIALLFPETDWMVGVNTLFAGLDGDRKKPFATQMDAGIGAKAISLLGFDDWNLADDVVYSRHVIDRRFYSPAVDINLYPRLALNDTYWTSTLVKGSEQSAFYVDLDDGDVYDVRRDNSGFGLPCRRARQ